MENTDTFKEAITRFKNLIYENEVNAVLNETVECLEDPFGDERDEILTVIAEVLNDAMDRRNL